MKKEVVIIEPRSASANVFSMFSYLPLLGTVYLGTILKNEGFNVRVLNENILKRDVSTSELDADFLLISCLTPTVTRGYEIAREYRHVRPSGKVIMGGPHVSFLKEEAAEYADHVVIGEGENVIVDLLKFGSDEKFIYGTPVKNLDDLPFIDWSILEGNKRGSITSIMTSRGCPFACNFCSVTEMFGRGYRAMSPERVIEEVKRSHKRWIFFYDDNFTANLKRAHKIMDGMINIGVKKRTWTTQVRADVTKDEELVKKMAKSGCDRVYIGFESINPNTLETFKKSQTPEDISSAVEILHKHGIGVHGMFMYGSDTDDSSVVRETQDFVKKTKIDTVQFMILTPMPGTEVFREMEAAGRLIHRNWEHYDGLHAVFWPKKFSPFDLQRYSVESFRKFYSMTNAANEMINAFADKAKGTILIMANKGKTHSHSFKNALFRFGGKFIVDKWQRINHSYLHYLHQISEARAGK